MNDQRLDRNLRSIGKECFVTFFEEFCDPTRSNESVAARIKEERGYTDKACQSRTSHARSIINAGRAKDGLICCSKSIRLPQLVRDTATVLAARL